VKKIFGILVALSLVLSLAVMATPVMAVVMNVTVALTGPCAGQVGVYNISFNLSASLTEGTHSLCIKFPAGTVIPNTGSPTPWFNGDIETDVGDVYGSEVTVTGTEVCFLVPTTMDVGRHWVRFTSDACIINPETPGAYQLEVYTDRAPDTLPVKNSLPYNIIPCFSTYVFEWDSSPSFPGIAKDFVPPFKACGQNCSDIDGMIGCVDCDLLGVGNASGWLEAFNITFGTVKPPLIGCESPCELVDIYLQLTNSPQVACGLTPSSVTLNLTTYDPAAENVTGIHCGCDVLTWEPCMDPDGIPDEVELADDYALAYNTTIEWEGYIHFDTPGDYTICFTAECVGGFPACTPPNCEDGNILVQKCIDFHVHQWKDAAKIPLDEKWNLISLPLVPFDTDLGNMLSSIDLFDYATYVASGGLVIQSNLLSIWYYDAAADEWLVNGNGQDSLTTIEDGKAYWLRLRYPLELPAHCGGYGWWVFGTELPEPPDGPKVYSVEAGWNMVGFTSMSALANNVYLANWAATPIPNPVIMGWTHGCFATQGWYSVAFGGTTLTPGQGYWIAFPYAGSVYQSVP